MLKKQIIFSHTVLVHLARVSLRLLLPPFLYLSRYCNQYIANHCCAGVRLMAVTVVLTSQSCKVLPAQLKRHSF